MLHNDLRLIRATLPAAEVQLLCDEIDQLRAKVSELEHRTTNTLKAIALHRAILEGSHDIANALHYLGDQVRELVDKRKAG